MFQYVKVSYLCHFDKNFRPGGCRCYHERRKDLAGAAKIHSQNPQVLLLLILLFLLLIHDIVVSLVTLILLLVQQI